MRLKELKLYNFRNVADGTLQFGDGITLISGSNGQGKTNILEAISFLSHAKSFRTPKSREVIRWGGNECSIFGTIAHDISPTHTQLGVSISSRKKEGYRDGVRMESLADFIGVFTTVGFTPTDLLLVKGSPGERRAFLDKHIIYFEAKLFQHLLTYQRALRNKNALLAAARENPSELPPEKVAPWNRILSESAVQITAARKRFLGELESEAKAVYRQFAPSEEQLSLSLLSGIEQRCGVELSAEQVFAALQGELQRELRNGRSVIGPHRDDIQILIADREARLYASQGQTRSIVLALKLAVIHLLERQRRERPVLLLDDVDSELDRQRAGALFDVIFRGERQVIITCTSADRIPISPERYRLLQVRNGVVQG